MIIVIALIAAQVAPSARQSASALASCIPVDAELAIRDEPLERSTNPAAFSATRGVGGIEPARCFLAGRKDVDDPRIVHGQDGESQSARGAEAQWPRDYSLMPG